MSFQLVEFKTIDEITNYQSKDKITITIGSFDAIHLGHQKLMQKTIEIAKENQTIPALLTFKFHPRKTLNSTKSGATIFSYEHRIELIAKFGIRRIFVIYFDDTISQLSPIDFIHKILIHSLNCQAIVTGEDFCFGKNRQGNVHFLKEIVQPLNISLAIVEPFLFTNAPVSTTRIRNYLLEKNMEGVNQLLGREYSLAGIVQKAHGRGKLLGFPTANIIPETDILPTQGVYITKTIYKNKTKFSITNIGFNPTFSDHNSLSIETHILNEDLSLHGERLEIIFLKFIRPEKKFDNIDDLKNQINEDIQIAKKFHGI